MIILDGQITTLDAEELRKHNLIEDKEYKDYCRLRARYLKEVMPFSNCNFEEIEILHKNGFIEDKDYKQYLKDKAAKIKEAIELYTSKNDNFDLSSNIEETKLLHETKKIDDYEYTAYHRIMAARVKKLAKVYAEDVKDEK